MSDLRKTIKITKNAEFIFTTMKAADEKPVTIYVNGEEYVTLMCTPVCLEELAAGFLAAEGIVSKKNQISNLTTDNDSGIVWVELKDYNKIALATSGLRYLPSGCGGSTGYHRLHARISEKCSFKIDNKIYPEDIVNNTKLLTRKKNESRGMHKAVLSAFDKKVLSEKIDVGRHNAVDKLLGDVLLNKKKYSSGILLTTGRISSEIIIKSYFLRTPIVISFSSPTSLALEIAEKLNITVIGYARGRSAYIYTVPERVVME